jgi:outer membrane translocation and assembly module TamA
MFATQAEYRLSLPESLGFFGKFGFVAFAGVGEVAPSFSNLNSDELLPGGGAGIRFLVARQNRINFRIDYAWGKAGSRGLYIGVGEAF